MHWEKAYLKYMWRYLPNYHIIVILRDVSDEDGGILYGISDILELINFHENFIITAMILVASCLYNEKR